MYLGGIMTDLSVLVFFDMKTGEHVFLCFVLGLCNLAKKCSLTDLLLSFFSRF